VLPLSALPVPAGARWSPVAADLDVAADPLVLVTPDVPVPPAGGLPGVPAGVGEAADDAGGSAVGDGFGEEDPVAVPVACGGGGAAVLFGAAVLVGAAVSVELGQLVDVGPGVAERDWVNVALLTEAAAVVPVLGGAGVVLVLPLAGGVGEAVVEPLAGLLLPVDGGLVEGLADGDGDGVADGLGRALRLDFGVLAVCRLAGVQDGPGVAVCRSLPVLVTGLAVGPACPAPRPGALPEVVVPEPVTVAVNWLSA
jgi:hypothetical protein